MPDTRGSFSCSFQFFLHRVRQSSTGSVVFDAHMAAARASSMKQPRKDMSAPIECMRRISM